MWRHYNLSKKDDIKKKHLFPQAQLVVNGFIALEMGFSWGSLSGKLPSSKFSLTPPQTNNEFTSQNKNGAAEFIRPPKGTAVGLSSKHRFCQVLLCC